MVYLLILLCVIFVSAIVAFRYLKATIVSPISLHSLSWMIVLLVGVVVYQNYDSFPEESFYSLLIWYLLFYFILAVGEVMITEGRYKYIDSLFIFSTPRYWMFIIPACILTIYEIYSVGSSGPESFLRNLRVANVGDDYSGNKFIFMPAFYPIIMSMFAISCLTSDNKINMASASFWQILFCIGTMGKFAVITPVFVYVVIRGLKSNLSIKKIVFISLFLMSLIMMVHFIRMTGDETSSLIDVLGIYIYSPIVALSKLPDFHSVDLGQYTFRFFYAFTYKLGLLTIEPVKTILEFVNVPIATNVFTAMQPFFQDFSYPGVALGAMVYGVFFSLLYGGARQGNPVYILIYALLSVSLLTSFFAETLITNLSGNIKISICVLILFWGTVKCKAKK